MRTLLENALQISEGFCWQCDVKLDPEGWCPGCRRRFRFTNGRVEELIFLPLEVRGKKLNVAGVHDGSTFLVGSPDNLREIVLGCDDVFPDEDTWMVTQWVPPPSVRL